VVADDVLLACRLSGLGVDELWLRFLELGGTRSKPELRERLAGAAWPAQEDRVLAVVAAEALCEAGLPVLAAVTPPPGLRPPVPVTGGPPAALGAALAPVPAGGGAGTALLHDRLSALYAQCAGTRAQARTVRARAVAARHASEPGGPGPGLLPGGR
jgi:hypothetical protein